MVNRRFGRRPQRRRRDSENPSSGRQKSQDMKSRSTVLELPPAMVVNQLAGVMDVPSVDLIKQLMRNGMMVTINQVIDYESAALVATELGYQVKRQQVSQSSETPSIGDSVEPPVDLTELLPRPPVVTILGHVDHGKTTLLDFIRTSSLASREIGGITQHIGAYQIKYKGNQITFLDTPGHEAFTAMRARGARITDVAVLVVAADDGVMPQTREAIAHVKVAGVPIVVAISKSDRPDADPDRVRRQLSEMDLLPEEWGGDTIMIPTSGTTGEGVEELLESLLVVAEILELRAGVGGNARGVVVEARLDKARGPIATILVQDGVLKLADTVVVGDSWGRARAILSDTGTRVNEAGPSAPIELLGLSTVPQAGDSVFVVPNERSAKNYLEAKWRDMEGPSVTNQALSLDQISTRISSGDAKELLLILKCDVQGSIEAVKNALARLSVEGAQAKIIHSGPGTITESDILLATASTAIVIGFNTRVEPGARRLAGQNGVEIRTYEIIYRLTEDIDLARQGLLEPEVREIVEAHVLVKTIFSRGTRAKVAGCQVTEGVFKRNATVRIIRDGQTMHTGLIVSLKRFRDDVREVNPGVECGVILDGFNDFLEGDVLEAFRIEH